MYKVHLWSTEANMEDTFLAYHGNRSLKDENQHLFTTQTVKTKMTKDLKAIIALTLPQYLWKYLHMKKECALCNNNE